MLKRIIKNLNETKPQGQELEEILEQIGLCSTVYFFLTLNSAKFLEQMEELLDCSCRKLDTFASALDAEADSDETESDNAESELESSD